MEDERVSLPPIGSMLHGSSKGPAVDTSINHSNATPNERPVSSVQIRPYPPPPLSPHTPQALHALQTPQWYQQEQYSSPPPSPFAESFPHPTMMTHPTSTSNHAKNHHRRTYSTESFLDEDQRQLRMYKAPTTHEPIPHDQHRYRCPTCFKHFSRPSSLRVHIYSHTGEKPHRCPHPGCGRRFSVQSNMRRHLRVHYCSSFSDDQQTQGTENASRPNSGTAVGPIPSLYNAIPPLS